MPPRKRSSLRICRSFLAEPLFAGNTTLPFLVLTMTPCSSPYDSISSTLYRSRTLESLSMANLFRNRQVKVLKSQPPDPDRSRFSALKLVDGHGAQHRRQDVETRRLLTAKFSTPTPSQHAFVPILAQTYSQGNAPAASAQQNRSKHGAFTDTVPSCPNTIPQKPFRSRAAGPEASGEPAESAGAAWSCPVSWTPILLGEGGIRNAENETAVCG